MNQLTQGRGAVVFMTVIMYTQPALMSAPADEEASGDCGLRYVQISKWTTKEATSRHRWYDTNCEIVYKGVNTKDNLYLIFKKFDVKDCEIKFGLFWGAQKEKETFNCETAPEIDKVYYVDGEGNLTITIEKADIAKKDFDIKFELTTNDTVISSGTVLIQEKMSLVGILSFFLGAMTISSLWRQ